MASRSFVFRSLLVQYNFLFLFFFFLFLSFHLISFHFVLSLFNFFGFVAALCSTDYCWKNGGQRDENKYEKISATVTYDRWANHFKRVKQKRRIDDLHSTWIHKNECASGTTNLSSKILEALLNVPCSNTINVYLKFILCHHFHSIRFSDTQVIGVSFSLIFIYISKWKMIIRKIDNRSQV